MDAFSARGLAFSRANYLPAGFSFAAAHAAMDAALSQGFGCTAVFAMSDIMAIGAARALADHGRSIPGDVSIMGFDGIALAHYMLPRLTTMCQNAEAIARESAALLALGLSDAPSVRHVTLDAELIEGESVANI